MTEDQKAEILKWHVSSAAIDDFRSPRMSEYCGRLMNGRVYEVMRGDEVKAILFKREDADTVCRLLGHAAAGVSA